MYLQHAMPRLPSFSQLLLSMSFVQSSLAYPPDAGVEITFPVPMQYTGSKLIPDADHPYIAPGPNDQRGPCPGLNTMANHGYLPRNGIVSFEDLLNGSQEAFNLDYNFTMAVSAFAILSRGNALLNRVSIGGESPLVPPLPGAIDGTPGGLSKHGRFEGDVSMTREDAAIGDNVHFQPDMYANLLTYVDQYGDGDIVTPDVFIQYRWDRFVDSYTRNPNLTYHVGRLGFSYGESGFVLYLFPNATQNLTVEVMNTFFQNETFPKHWFRRDSPFTFPDVGDAADEIITPYPVPPGAKNASDVYVVDTDPLMTNGCSIYYNLVGQNLPAVLLNTTGLLRKNVDLLLSATHPIFVDDCPVEQLPIGPAGV